MIASLASSTYPHWAINLWRSLNKTRVCAHFFPWPYSRVRGNWEHQAKNAEHFWIMRQIMAAWFWWNYFSVITLSNYEDDRKTKPKARCLRQFKNPSQGMSRKKRTYGHLNYTLQIILGIILKLNISDFTLEPSFMENVILIRLFCVQCCFAFTDRNSLMQCEMSSMHKNMHRNCEKTQKKIKPTLNPH